jgi:hypothetical protein
MKIIYPFQLLPILFLPNLLFFLFELITDIYKMEISTYFFYAIIIYMIIFVLYVILYYWRNLPMSPSSFFRFFIIISQLILYLLALKIYLNPLLTPIYLSDLSTYSQYKYLSLCLISIFSVITLFLLFLLKPSLLSTLSTLNFPYFKEEIRVFLYTWNNGFIGNLCIKIIDILNTSFIFSIIFFIIHFIIFYCSRLLSAVLLLYCVFFTGDFCIFIKLAPLFFFIWVLSFFNYYFLYFREGCATYICSLLIVTKNSNTTGFLGIVKLLSTDISFELSPLAIDKGYTAVDKPHLIQEWFIQAKLGSYFLLYNKFTKYFGFFIFFCRFIAWVTISSIFFFPFLFDKNEILSGGVTPIIRALFKPIPSYRSYATEARRVLPPHRKSLETITQGIHFGSHPALIDPDVKNPDNPKEVRYEGQLTHGKGSTKHESQPLHPTTDLMGKARPQGFIPPIHVTYVPEQFFESQSLPNSKSVLEHPKTKENLGKHLPREENT